MSHPTAHLPRPELYLPVSGPRGPSARVDQIAALQHISSATAAAVLHHMGVRQTTISGPVTTQPGRKIVGPAVTLTFMPQREDLASGLQQENAEKESALWHVLDAILPGDVLVVAAKGDPKTGCLGEMLLTYLKGRRAAGAVIDGFIRDWPIVREMDINLWLRGSTPNYASQANLYPWGYNVPADVAGVLVLPGDIIIADDDGVVVVPIQLVDLLIEQGTRHEGWESFSRMKLAEGGSIWRYYPLSPEGQAEYESWSVANRT